MISHGTTNDDLVVPDRLLVSTGRVFSALRGIVTSKSPSPDNIPNKILKTCTFAFELAPVISDLYNSSLRTSMSFSGLAEALIRYTNPEIPKISTPKLMQEDLCPIPLTSQVNKVMEGFTLESLMSEVAGKLDKKQFALPGKSTTQALVFLLHLADSYCTR